MMLCKFLRQFVRLGTIVVIGPRGQSEQITATETPRVTIRIKTRVLSPKLIFSPNFYLAEAYVNGDLKIEEGELSDLLTILMCSISDNSHPTLFDRLRAHLSHIVDSCIRNGGISRIRRQVQYHYDLSDDFFKLFLDQNMQYSCAYFLDNLKSLDAAQIAKMQHIAAKLSLRPEQRVLDIGSGWGGLAKFLNAAYHVDVTGITLSVNQQVASERGTSSEGVRFQLKDYRNEQGSYDRIVSVGMLEHVGYQNYMTYFAKVEELLRDDGIALVHTIARRGIPTPVNLWIRRRIFPGVYVPSLSQLAAVIERTGLWILDCENLRLHYAKTLQSWRFRLEAHKSRVEHTFGERFYRAWEFYLTSCELGFRYQGLTVYQLLLGKRPDSAPLTRDYIYDEEARLRALTVFSDAPARAAE